MICDKCNVEMKYFSEGHSCGWECPKCGQGVVTSYIDDQIYKLSILPCTASSAKECVTIAKICKISIKDAKSKIRNGGFLVEDRAEKIKEYCTLLDKTVLEYKTTPIFPYSDKN
ncbi:MAG: hypothetical protein J6U54_04920 [Clostridiales bacterium]|nr:hypothetical protein [Clostridiales bacterium]